MGDKADALLYRWIAGRIAGILQNEDDVVIELCFNLMESSRYVCSNNLLRMRHQINNFVARDQEASDTADRVPRKGNTSILP